MLRKFLMKLFSLWEWNNIFPKYRNMICVILNSMSWVTVSSTVVSLTIASAGQRSSMMSITIYLLATSLTACLTVKLVVEYAKAPLEAKAYAPRAKVLRDGMWINVHAVNLVPGDIIFLKVGDIVPANARVLRFEKINTMTCWAKRSVDCVHGFLIYYAWTVSCGQGTAAVIATGRDIPRSTLRLYPQRYTRPGQLKEGIMIVGCFCFSLVLFGTIAELWSYAAGWRFMALIGVVPMAMPVVLYLALAFGSLRLCLLGVASRGTVALEDLASMDVMLFNMTGTITCNKPSFARDKIELFAKGVNEDQAIVLASRASRSQHELYIEPIDPAILSLLDDPEQARAGVQVIEHHAHFFVSLKLMFLATYIDENGSKCCVFKGDPANASHLYNIHTTEKRVAHQCGCSKAVKERISMIMDNLAVDGYQAIAVGHQSDSCWEFAGLLPFKEDLRHDSADALNGLISLGLDIIVLTGESHIGISVADATDYTKTVQISREICQMMKGYMIYTVSSTVHLFGVHAILLLWNFDLPSFLTLVIAAFNYCCGQCKIDHKSLMDTDEEIRAALFLQMSIVNQAVALFAYSDDCCHIRCPGPVVTFAFIFTQMVATRKAVGGDLDFAIAKGVGWLKAGLIWLYNFVLLLVPVDLSDMEACKDDWRNIVDEAFSHPTYSSALVTVHNT
uniref:P-type ATPase A domain-containing protein n=1 Tax=Oryza nivara TaxID=4536 RepID=A0A0E0J4Q9_ORYNI